MSRRPQRKRTQTDRYGDLVPHNDVDLRTANGERKPKRRRESRELGPHYTFPHRLDFPGNVGQRSDGPAGDVAATGGASAADDAVCTAGGFGASAGFGAAGTAAGDVAATGGASAADVAATGGASAADVAAPLVVAAAPQPSAADVAAPPVAGTAPQPDAPVSETLKYLVEKSRREENEMKRLLDDNTALQKSEKGLRDKLSVLYARNTELEEVIESLKTDLGTARDKISRVNGQCLKVTGQFHQVTGQCRKVKAQFREVTRERDNLRAQNANLEKEKKCHLARIVELNQLRSQISDLTASPRWAQSCPVNQIPVGIPVAPPSTCPTASAARILAQISEQQ